jgi:NTP pyrophosphatase (non-canonical NTP hydrolase)
LKHQIIGLKHRFRTNEHSPNFAVPSSMQQHSDISISQYQQMVDEWVKTIGVRYYGELTNTAILMEEVGEVARLMARLYGEQSFKRPEMALTAHQDLADEMADVLFVLTCLANQTGIDLTAALHKNFEKKTSRDKERHANNPKLKSGEPHE